MEQQKPNAKTAGVREGGKLRITWVKSSIGHKKDQKETIVSLGLHRLNDTVEQPDNASTRGMVFKVKHLVTVEEI